MVLMVGNVAIGNYRKGKKKTEKKKKEKPQIYYWKRKESENGGYSVCLWLYTLDALRKIEGSTTLDLIQY